MYQNFICTNLNLRYFSQYYNTLTSQGIHVRDCIQGGALLARAALLLGTPPTTIVSVLPTVAQLGVCGDAVDFSKLNLGQLQGLGSIFR